MKDLSEIGEALRETSSQRHTEVSTVEKMQQHLKRTNRYISRVQQKANLQGGGRRAALLLNSTVDEKRDIEDIFESMQFFMSHFKNAPSDQITEILSVSSILPGLFEMQKKAEAGRIAYLCKTIAQNI